MMTRKGAGPAPRRKSIRNAPNHLDDDDFSVAPSMDQDVKSVVSVVFDDVYKRGRKVSRMSIHQSDFFHQNDSGKHAVFSRMYCSHL